MKNINNCASRFEAILIVQCTAKYSRLEKQIQKYGAPSHATTQRTLRPRAGPVDLVGLVLSVFWPTHGDSLKGYVLGPSEAEAEGTLGVLPKNWRHGLRNSCPFPQEENLQSAIDVR